MKKFISIIILALSPIFSFSQVVDSILMNNGLKSIIKVVSIESSSISYTVPGDASNTVYSVKKNEIKKLYLNSDLTKNNGTAKPASESRQLSSFSRNLIGFNMTQMVFTTLSFNYEHIIKDGSIGLRAYAGGNLNAHTMNYSEANGPFSNDLIAPYRKFTGGIEINLFPFKQQKRTSYYVGPAFQVGVLDIERYSYSYYYTKELHKNVTNISFVLNNGMLIRPSNNFFLDLNGGVGIQRVNISPSGYYDANNVHVRFSLQFSMGYSF